MFAVALAMVLAFFAGAIAIVSLLIWIAFKGNPFAEDEDDTFTTFINPHTEETA